MTFNLVDEPWILAVSDAGQEELSLREVFRRRKELSAISGDVPTQAVAILRLLLAVVHATHDTASVDAILDLHAEGLDSHALDDYLDAWRHRFELFDPNQPFYQVPDLRTSKGEHSGLEKLIADVPNGEPFFTTRGGRGLATIRPAEAARWLVHVHAFDPSGIRSGAVGDPEVKGGRGYPIGPSWVGQLGSVVIHGRSLEQTLTHNLTPRPDPEDVREAGLGEDRPIWELPPQTSVRSTGDVTPAGPMSLLTWQSRRVRLVQTVDGLVGGLVLAQGDRLFPQNAQRFEPMSAWRFSKPQTDKAGFTTYMPRKHDEGRSLWRTLPAVLAADLDTDDPAPIIQPATLRLLREEGALRNCSVQAVGVTYGPQEATIEEIIDDRIAMNVDVLVDSSGAHRAMLAAAVRHTEEAVRAVTHFAANLAKASGERGDGAGEGAGRAVGELCFAALDAPARHWVESISVADDPIELHRKWQATVHQVLSRQISRLYRDAPPAARRGRLISAGRESRFVTADVALAWCQTALNRALPLHIFEKTTTEEKNG